MNSQNNQPKFNLVRMAKKLFLSGFVVITFIAYALHKQSTPINGSVGLAALTPGGAVPTQTDTPGLTPNTRVPQTAAPAGSTAASPQPALPTPTTAATVPSNNGGIQSGAYKNGTYTGPEVDAIYGLVQVQAVIQNGKIADVQFLEYPNDRRTSVRINSYAVPYLQQEAIQAQSANVNMVTGATLTSEAFQMSLQSALDKAKGAL